MGWLSLGANQVPRWTRLAARKAVLAAEKKLESTRRSTGKKLTALQSSAERKAKALQKTVEKSEFRRPGGRACGALPSAVLRRHLRCPDWPDCGLASLRSAHRAGMRCKHKPPSGKLPV